MRVLVACEYSGTVREAFSRLGHDAWSCDLLPSDAPGNHHQQDCLEVISLGWDLIIMHPPCTALAVSGNRHYGTDKPKAYLRVKANEWTWALWNHALEYADRVAMENPISILSRTLKPSQVIQPWMFGHPEQKATCLWLHGLEKLRETDNVYDRMTLLPKKERERVHFLPPSADRWKIRSTTFQGVADAMANQWGGAA